MFVFSGLYCLTYFSDASLFGPIICPPRLTSRPGRDPEGGGGPRCAHVLTSAEASASSAAPASSPRAPSGAGAAARPGAVHAAPPPADSAPASAGGSGRKLRALHPGSRPGSTTAEQTGRASLLGLCQDQPLPMGAVPSPGEGGRWLQEAFLDCPLTHTHIVPHLPATSSQAQAGSSSSCPCAQPGSSPDTRLCSRGCGIGQATLQCASWAAGPALPETACGNVCPRLSPRVEGRSLG